MSCLVSLGDAIGITANPLLRARTHKPLHDESAVDTSHAIPLQLIQVLFCEVLEVVRGVDSELNQQRSVVSRPLLDNPEGTQGLGELRGMVQ
jgi:hypothetical protein